MKIRIRATCPECRVTVDKAHKKGCDVERCTACGGQRLQCACPMHDRKLAAWRGYWPGVLACIELGWFRWADGEVDDADRVEGASSGRERRPRRRKAYLTFSGVNGLTPG
jgi:hypothetical protein